MIYTTRIARSKTSTTSMVAASALLMLISLLLDRTTSYDGEVLAFNPGRSRGHHRTTHNGEATFVVPSKSSALFVATSELTRTRSNTATIIENNDYIHDLSALASTESNSIDARQSKHYNSQRRTTTTTTFLSPRLDQGMDLLEERDDYKQFENWCYAKLERWYTMSQKVKCPFFRRRYSDMLDHLEWFVRHFVVIDKLMLGPTLACQSIDNGKAKTTNLSIDAILEMIRKDWEGSKNRIVSNVYNGTTFGTTVKGTIHPSRGYYVTGKFSTSIYRDDCWFTSPDPDLPIQGLRKYVGVASHLFDSKTSSSELISLIPVINDDLDDDDDDDTGTSLKLRAVWKMSLTLKLPWRPQLPTFSGTTTYHLDENHLIHHHEETWDISVFDAFWAMFELEEKKSAIYERYGGTSSTPSPSKCPFAFLHRSKKNS